MALNFITGSSGSGKSTVSKEIAARGFTIYDTDDPDRTGMAGWHNLETGQYVAGFNEITVNEELLATHVWRLTDSALDSFKARSVRELIFLCGRLRDAQSVIEASRHLIYLAATDESIRNRLEQRSKIPGEVEWGREPWQIEYSIKINSQLEAEYRAIGAIMINTDQPVSSVVDDILNASSE